MAKTAPLARLVLEAKQAKPATQVNVAPLDQRGLKERWAPPVHKGYPVTLSCGAGLEGASGLTFSYWATIFADGTVWASAEIVDSFTATSGSRIYAANQNGALTNTKHASTGSTAIPSVSRDRRGAPAN